MHTIGWVSKHLGGASRQIRLLFNAEVLWGREFIPEVSDSTLPRKVSIEDIGARTANRHR